MGEQTMVNLTLEYYSAVKRKELSTMKRHGGNLNAYS